MESRKLLGVDREVGEETSTEVQNSAENEKKNGQNIA